MASVVTAISGLQNLPNLQNFNGDYNGFIQIDFSGMDNLQYLDISDCDLPDGETSSLTQVNLSACSSLIELRLDDSNFSASGMASIIGFNNLINLELVDLDQCGIQGVVDFSGKPNLRYIDISGNIGITGINILNTQPIETLYANTNALSQASVDAILTTLSINGVQNGTVYLDSGTNAVPSSTGFAAKSVLETNGWYVLVNTPPPGYVTVPATTDFDLTGDFTIETFVNFSSVSGFPRIYSFGAYPSANAISYENGYLYVWLNGSVAISAQQSFTLGDWYHVAVMRSSNRVDLFVNGVSIGNNEVIGTISSNNVPLTIGYGNESSSELNGLISNFRWTNSAVYSNTGFSVPTALLTDLTDTKLLLLQGTSLEAQLTDLSGNANDATGVDVSYNAASPISGEAGSIKFGL